MTRKAANEAGETEALTWYATGDRTHPAVKGARLYASFFLEDVQRRGLPISKLFFEDNLMDRIAIICAHPDDLIGCLGLCHLAGIHPEIWFMEQTHQSKRFAPDILLDFSAVADKVWASLRLYECQYGGGGLENRRRMLAELNGLRSAEYGGKVLAEGYVRFTPRRQGERSVFDELPFPGGSQGIPLQGARN